MLDINSTGESVEVINKMMEWSSKYDLHIHCVLHLNKGDNNVRGHIGTEMSNKAETVLVISKNNDCPNVSEVHALHIREKEFKPLLSLLMRAGSRFSQKGICLRMPHIRNRNSGRVLWN